MSPITATGPVHSCAEPASSAEPERLVAGTGSVAREALFALLGGQPVHLTSLDLVALSNLAYDGLSPDRPFEAYSVAQVVLDSYLLRVGDQRRVGGARARDVAYDLCRYVLPFLLEHRSVGPLPLPVTALCVQDVRYFANVLAGERALPAAVIAARHLPGRLALSCHWVSLAEAGEISGLGETELKTRIDTGLLPTYSDVSGQSLIRAVDLAEAGLLDAGGTSPHGLSKDSADNIHSLLRVAWQHALDLGVPLVGNPQNSRAKQPLRANRQNPAKSQPRRYVALSRCVEVARYLHPVHQTILWTQRTLGARVGEVFGPTIEDYHDGWLHLAGVGGARRDVRGDDGRFVSAHHRRGTKGSAEGLGLANDPTDTAGPGLLQRRIPLPAITRELLDTVIAIFHTDPATGHVEPGARLVPGLQHADRSGLSAYESALKQACELSSATSVGGPATFTSHDLRASLQTDLDNAGVDERVSRYMLGHRSNHGQPLDVHERHYDLGPDARLLMQATAIIDALVRDTVTDLRIPTAQRAQFGADTIFATRRGFIDRQLRCGWYRPAGVAGDQQTPGAGEPVAEAFTVAEAAQELGVKTSQIKRLIASGSLLAVRAAWGRRQIWLITRASIEHERARRSQPTLASLSDELDLGYHHLWHLMGELGIGQGRPKGHAVQVSAHDAETLRHEVARRQSLATTVLPTAQVAARLNVSPPMVHTLLRRGDLLAAEGFDTPLSYVSLASVECYEARHPAPPAVADRERIVRLSRVGAILGTSRHSVTHLVCTRQLAIIWIQRRQYVGVDSLRRYLDQHPGHGHPGLVALYSEAQP